MVKVFEIMFSNFKQELPAKNNKEAVKKALKMVFKKGCPKGLPELLRIREVTPDNSALSKYWSMEEALKLLPSKMMKGFRYE